MRYLSEMKVNRIGGRDASEIRKRIERTDERQPVMTQLSARRFQLSNFQLQRSNLVTLVALRNGNRPSEA